MRLLHSATLIAVLTAAAIQSAGAQTNPTKSESSPARYNLSADSPDLARVDDLTNQVLRKEIELEKLNTRFRLETSLVSPWRQRRMFLYAQANSWLTQASLISQMKIRNKLAKEKRPPGPSNVIFNTDEDFPADIPPADLDSDGDLDSEDSNILAAIQDGDPEEALPLSPTIPRIRNQNGKERGRLAAAVETQLTGQLIGAAGDVIEMGLNFNNYWRLRRKGLTPALYRKNVQAIHADLDSLIETRQRFCSEARLSSADRLSVNAEGKLLNDLRDLELTEYNEFHAAVKKFWTLQNTAYLVDLTKNMLGATGNIVSLKGNHMRRPRMQGTAGIFSILSGTAVLLTPVVGRVTGNLSGLAARRLVSNELNSVATTDLKVFSADKQNLQNLLASTPGVTPPRVANDSVTKRATAYANLEKVLQETLRYQESQEKRAHSTLVENIVFAGLVAPPRIANGVCQVLGGWRYYTNHSLANKVFFAGATAYASGTAINIAETIRLQVAFERRYHGQRKTHSTSKEQFLSKLKRLDQMDSLLSGR